MNEKQHLFQQGRLLIENWCALNGIDVPKIEEHEDGDGEAKFGVCAYYRDSVIKIWVSDCAAIGRYGRSWSYPGYSVDRTPYGVLAHELGHHVDRAHGPRGGIHGKNLIRVAGEEPISGYIGTPPNIPDLNEIFAEHFRLFVTNPNYHNLVRPNTFCRMFERWPALAEPRRWNEVLKEERYVNAARNKIRAAEKKMDNQIPLAGLLEKL